MIDGGSIENTVSTFDRLPAQALTDIGSFALGGSCLGETSRVARKSIPCHYKMDMLAHAKEFGTVWDADGRLSREHMGLHTGGGKAGRRVIKRITVINARKMNKGEHREDDVSAIMWRVISRTHHVCT